MNEKIENLIKEFLTSLGFEHKIDFSSQEEGKEKINILVSDIDRWAINKQEVLASFNHLIYLLARKKLETSSNFIIDVNGWRESREKEIKDLVLEKAKEARFFKKAIYLPPMSSFERRAVHLALSNETDLKTESVGDDPDRCVVIRPVIV